jgi:quercetin dioxygenase-like cupin family protein
MARPDSGVGSTDEHIANSLEWLHDERRCQSHDAQLFVFDAGQGLTEHTSPYDAMVLVLEGEFVLVIDGVECRAGAGSIVRLPANVPHALDAPVRSRMLLMMVK